jgi:hypothetical protein
MEREGRKKKKGQKKMEQEKRRQIKNFNRIEKKINTKNYFKSKFLPCFEEEWVSSVFNEYTGGPLSFLILRF